MEFEGTVFRYGRDIDTDVIIPARYLNTSDPAELAKHCLEDLDTTFVKRVKPGDIIVADENFGCGSSREHAAMTLKGIGVGAILAESFGRIFYRNVINLGLPAITCKGVSKAIQQGDEVRVDFTSGTITNLRTGAVLSAEPMNAYMESILEKGGIKPLIRAQLAGK